jgi:hypothetical protein
MKTCTICKGSIAYPEITGKTHFVCDGRVPARKPFAVGMALSQASADTKWTPEEQRKVDAAILHVARIAGRLNAAARRGIIRNTGELAYAQRGGAHDHAQRLSVWAGI